MNEVPHGKVRVRLTSRPDLEPYAEFSLSESDLAERIRPSEVGGIDSSVEHIAAEVVWGLTQLTVDEALELASEGRIPHEYAAQLKDFRSVGYPPMTPGQYADVALGNGAHSTWRCTELGWELVERTPPEQETRRDGGAEIEAER